MAQTAARQGGARARSRHAGALKDHQGKRGRVSQLCRPFPRARGAIRTAAASAAAAPAVPVPFFAYSQSRRPLAPNAGAARVAHLWRRCWSGPLARPLVRSSFVMMRRAPRSTLLPYTTLFRSKPQPGKGALELARATLGL